MSDANQAPPSLGILLLSAAHERAHYAFVIASGAAALGREVILFATNAGCRALLSDWSGLPNAARDNEVMSRGVAGFAELREAAATLGVRMLVCEAGLRAEAIDPASLMPGVSIAGVATFLAATRQGQLITL